uniref:RING-type domain-containing protein n=1 Tax=Glossina brevipalpis TaxID=37001 RepID=A0A1A9WYH7_9MUSC
MPFTRSQGFFKSEGPLSNSSGAIRPTSEEADRENAIPIIDLSVTPPSGNAIIDLSGTPPSDNAIIDLCETPTLEPVTVRNSSGDDAEIIVVTDINAIDGQSLNGVNDNTSNNYISPICPICMESVIQRQPTSTRCGHVYCKRCICRALEHKRKCPKCNAKTLPAHLHPLYL